MARDVPSWQEIALRAERRLAPLGFDLLRPFRVGAFNERISEPALRLPDFSRGDRLALLVGNTRALWPLFRRALVTDTALAGDPHPLDRYTVRGIERLLAELPPAVVRFAHVLRPQPLPIQRVAQAAGLAWLSPSHLSIHSRYGPWIALRAVLVVDVPGPDSTSPAVDPCTPCSKPCVPALEQALAASERSRATGAPLDVGPWVAVRDACPVGRSERYGADQIAYHYARLGTALAGDAPR